MKAEIIEDGGEERVDSGKNVYPMDTAYSFLVLFCSFIIYGIVFGMACSYGVYVVEFLNEFQCSIKEANSVGSLVYAAINFSGPLASVLYMKFGCRFAIVTGSLVAATGYALSYFTVTVHQLMVTQAMTGIGFGLQIVPCITAQAEYFTKYRSFALSFVTIGSAFGLFIFPPLYIKLIDLYGMRGSMLINSGIALQGAVCGMLVKSRRNQARNVKISEIFDFAVFRDKKFYAIAYTNLAWSGSCYGFYSMINSLEISHGLTPSEAALSVSVCGIVDTFNRIFGALASYYFFNRCLPIYTLSYLVFGIAIFSATFSYSLPGFLAVTSLFGTGFGFLISHFSVVCLWVFGLDRLHSVQGYSFLAGGVGVIFVSLLAGTIADELGRFEPSFYFVAAVNLSGVVCCLLLMYFTFSERRREKYRNEKEEHPLTPKDS